MAAQSAWLEAENTWPVGGAEEGDAGPAPDVRKRVTSLAPPPADLDMVLLALEDERRERRRGRGTGEEGDRVRQDRKSVV